MNGRRWSNMYVRLGTYTANHTRCCSPRVLNLVTDGWPLARPTPKDDHEGPRRRAAGVCQARTTLPTGPILGCGDGSTESGLCKYIHHHRLTVADRKNLAAAAALIL